MTTKICSNCQQPFDLTDEHLGFYKKLEVPEPTHCPDCRQQRRLAWCNERKLYKRECDLTHKPILSCYTPDVTFPVYYVKEWWSDKWDPISFGQEYDFAKPFFDQWANLNKKVPRSSLNVSYSSLENSEYVNYAGNLKNCYLIFDTDYSRDCYYGYTVNKSTNAVDCLKVNGCEICYECIDCNNCYNLKFGINCRNCNDSWFLKNCIGCNNCFGCANLERKQFCMYNQQLTQEEYKKKIAEINTGSFSTMVGLKQYVRSAYLSFPNKDMRGFQNENCTGDGLFNCKDTQDSYDCLHCHECKHCYSMSFGTKTSHDIYQFGENIECCYENTVIGYGGFNLKFSHTCNMGNNNLSYCQDCMGSKNCFGCIGLRHKQYCILNKQYTEEKYNELLPQIIEQMTRTGEWGEYFPIQLSNFAYNQTTAQEYYPLTREQALEKGYKWLDDDKKEFRPGTCQAPDDINQTQDLITNETLACTTCGKNYKIIPQELKFYKQIPLPIPQRCPDCRHMDRMYMRNPRHLWNRVCAKCNTAIKTTYAPEKPDIVYCEKCYLETIG
ncbi:MAG: hypothetical protein WCT46_00535 [Candidatus Gracilibacteria bacterium]|jgi:hypothetical protein